MLYASHHMNKQTFILSSIIYVYCRCIYIQDVRRRQNSAEIQWLIYQSVMRICYVIILLIYFVNIIVYIIDKYNYFVIMYYFCVLHLHKKLCEFLFSLVDVTFFFVSHTNNNICLLMIKQDQIHEPKIMFV